MKDRCIVCEAQDGVRRPEWPFRIEGRVYDQATPVCLRHELARACVVCHEPTPDQEDPFCADCRAAVEF